MNFKQTVSIYFIGLFLIFTAACSNSPQQPAQTANTSTGASKANDSQVISSHSQSGNDFGKSVNQNPAPIQKSESKTKWTQGGEPVDTSAFDAEIAKTEKDLKAKPKDESAKKAVAESYVKRAVALTDARQYASALGDYRRALKYDANNTEAKSWVEQIIGIYQSMNREAPKEGEEPPPLPIGKKT